MEALVNFSHPQKHTKEGNDSSGGVASYTDFFYSMCLLTSPLLSSLPYTPPFSPLKSQIIVFLCQRQKKKSDRLQSTCRGA